MRKKVSRLRTYRGNPLLARWQIGSLYRFFPNKEVLADALIQRYGELIDEAFCKIESQMVSSSVNDLADKLVDLLVELHGESQAMTALLESRSEWSVKRTEFRKAALRESQDPDAPFAEVRPDTADDIAVVLLQNMKTMKAITLENGFATSPGAPGRTPGDESTLFGEQTQKKVVM